MNFKKKKNEKSIVKTVCTLMFYLKKVFILRIENFNLYIFFFIFNLVGKLIFKNIFKNI